MISALSDVQRDRADRVSKFPNLGRCKRATQILVMNASAAQAMPVFRRQEFELSLDPQDERCWKLKWSWKEKSPIHPPRSHSRGQLNRSRGDCRPGRIRDGIKKLGRLQPTVTREL
jgi:hypothetical protein